MGGMSLWQALVLGLVQGLTEFIPVSSTAHLRIVPAVLGWPDPGTAFSAVIQLGTLAAVLLYFQRDLRRLLSAGVRSLWRADVRAGQDAGLAWAIVAGNVPIVVLGLTFRGQIETQARSLPLIAGMLIAVALLLALAERRAPRRLGMEALRLRQVLAIGLWQALALIPGTSRSGATILGGLLAGLRREDAARFSFLLGVPAILGSGLLELHGLLTYGGIGGVGGGAGGTVGGTVGAALLLGLAVSALSGYAAIGFLLRFLRTHSTAAFIVYRLLLGGLVLLLWAEGLVR